MVTTLAGINDGARFTVAELQKNPTLVQPLILNRLAQGFLCDTLLRDVGSTGSSVVKYWESTPLYAQDDAELVAEYGEIPTTVGTRGTPKVAVAQKKGLGLLVSQEMIDENDVDAVRTQRDQIVNTTVRHWDRALKTMITGGSTPTINATAHWGANGSAVRLDIADSMEKVMSAVPDNTQADDAFEFMPDTLVMNTSLWTTLAGDTGFSAILQNSPLADEQILYTGKQPTKLLGLDVLLTRTWPATEVFICERKRLGGYSDTRPLRVTPLYELGGSGSGTGGPTETWRSDVTRKTAMFLDQPKAGVRLLAVA
jgi:hypothetical protein